MSMYEPNNLYDAYIKRSIDTEFSPDLPDVTKKTTLDGINRAINLCQRWDRAMDIGCGNGHYLSALSAKFRKNVGVELDTYPEQAQLAKNFPHISFFNDLVEKYPEEEKFDFLLLMDIFEHIPDLPPFLAKLARLQDSGGIIYITTPNPIFCSPAEESEISAKRTGYHGHIKHYTKKEIESLMKDAGYEPEFHFYEETIIREYLRRIAKGISRRDLNWSKHFAYRIVRPLALLVLKPIFWVIKMINEFTEHESRHDMFDTRSFAIAFKKI